MSAHEKTIANVPVRRVSVGQPAAEKGESDKDGTQNSSVVGERGGDRGEILRRAREAKERKRQLKSQKNEPVVDTVKDTGEQRVDSSVPTDDFDVDGDSDDHSDDDNVPVPVPSRKRKALARAIFGKISSEDGGEEPPRKKPKTSDKSPTAGSISSFVMDKAIDIVRLAAASGVASVGFVILKSLAGSQIVTVSPSAGISAEWVKQ